MSIRGRRAPDPAPPARVDLARLGTTERGWPYYGVTATFEDGAQLDLGTVTNLGGIWESSARSKLYRTSTTDTRHEAVAELLRDNGLQWKHWQ